MFKKKESTHVNILGVDIPLATIAYATSTVMLTFDEICEQVGRLTASEIEMLASNSAFDALATHRDGRLPVHTGINRQFFQYKTLSDVAYDGSI